MIRIDDRFTPKGGMHMEVSTWWAWRDKSRVAKIFGIRVGNSNRMQHFNGDWPGWPKIEAEMDGQFHSFILTDGFWKDCPHFNDKGKPLIQEWLRRHKSLTWSPGSPPRMTLVPLGGGKFRLIP